MKTKFKGQPPVDNNGAADGIIDRIVELSEVRVEQGQRDQHPKQHGCVWAEFTILKHLPKKLKVGVFAAPHTFPAWIRFSNGQAQNDSKGDLVYGMAIKLMGVKGKKVLEGEEQAETQDFVLSTLPAFFVNDAEDYVELLEKRRANNSESMAFAQFLVPSWSPLQWRWREAQILLPAGLKKFFGKPASPLEIPYWSGTPYRLGSQAIKFFVKPAIENHGTQSSKKDSDYLSKAMVNHLTYRSAEFDFYVQLQNEINPNRTPVDDPRIVWKNAETYRVARIRIPAQIFDLPEQREFGENLSFTPWHCLPEHEPLGDINQVRKDTYQHTSKRRHVQRNLLPQEPTPDAFTPQLLDSVMLSDRSVQQYPLTVVVKIRTDRKADLEAILESRIKTINYKSIQERLLWLYWYQKLIKEVDKREEFNPWMILRACYLAFIIIEDNEIRSRFRDSNLTHFSRFVILEDQGTLKGLEPHLYFSTNYDGAFEDYIQELIALMGDKLDKIFECCEGYTVGWALNPARLTRFIRSHSFQPENVFYNAYQFTQSKYGLSVAAIRQNAEIYAILKRLLQYFDSLGFKLSLLDFYSISLPASLPAPSIWSTIIETVKKLVEKRSDSLLGVGSKLLQFLLGINSNRPPDLVKIVELNEQFDLPGFKRNLKTLTALEDKITQNQITVLTPLKTWRLPYGIEVDWFYRIALTIVLFLLKRGAPNGLPKLGTIHLARWVIVDLETQVNKRRRKASYLLFESNYDEAWDAYIDDFVRYTRDGMNVIWGPCVGFPETGADDIEWFKYYIRQHQFPAQMFYSAHPNLSIGQIQRDRKIGERAIQLLNFLQHAEVQRFLTNL
ncbi:catalase family protein [Thermocoleostomius sinensis]|uniref:Catalase family protein n=1 Tax=Thermocoleostomius sinensis A174 TaxID=2016057 RepID=A0A9E9CBY5_9CYAN|nr:catalase family protein [Thermocoleostomius sinensis]WAL61490.1 catalase family protein [Thermocoleostomius sinensis A174]